MTPADIDVWLPTISFDPYLSHRILGLPPKYVQGPASTPLGMRRLPMLHLAVDFDVIFLRDQFSRRGFG